VTSMIGRSTINLATLHSPQPFVIFVVCVRYPEGVIQVYRLIL
jgi:hypothetical protein